MLLSRDSSAIAVQQLPGKERKMTMPSSSRRIRRGNAIVTLSSIAMQYNIKYSYNSRLPSLVLVV
jgi:hypothetical protein